jgi:poly(A) polymerase
MNESDSEQVKTAAPSTPRVLQRAEHPISRKNIHDNALKVLYRLRQGGYLAYLVGGGVRDLLIDKAPKDYDIATDARPQQMKSLFRNSRIIGRRFRIAHVYFREGIVEVSTFRRDPDPAAQAGAPGELLITDDNIFGTPREDAFRRDFTVNALFYEIVNFSVIDYVGGLDDLRDGVIRCVGDPDVRFQEDPVRMLRACEMAARLNFEIETVARDSISQHCERNEQGAPARISEELLQILGCGSCAPAFEWMRKLGLLDTLLPSTTAGSNPTEEIARRSAELFQAVDSRIGGGAELSPVVLSACVLLPAYLSAQEAAASAAGRVLPRYKVRELACEHIKPFAERFSLPRQRTEQMVQSFQVLNGLQRPNPTHRERVRHAGRPGFSDALELLALMAQAWGGAAEDISHWRVLQKRVAKPKELSTPSSERRRPRRRRRRRR